MVLKIQLTTPSVTPKCKADKWVIVTEYRVFTGVFSDPTLQLSLRNYLRFWYSIREEYAYIYGKPGRILSLFQIHIFEVRLSLIDLCQSNMSQWIKCRSRYENATIFLKTLMNLAKMQTMLLFPLFCCSERDRYLKSICYVYYHATDLLLYSYT